MSRELVSAGAGLAVGGLLVVGLLNTHSRRVVLAFGDRCLDFAMRLSRGESSEDRVRGPFENFRLLLQFGLWSAAAALVLHGFFIILAATFPELYTVNAFWPFRIFGIRLGIANPVNVVFLVLGATLMGVLVAHALGRRSRCFVRPSVNFGLLLVLSLALTLALNASQGGPSAGLVEGPLLGPDSVLSKVTGALPPSADMLARFDDGPSTFGNYGAHYGTHPPLIPFVVKGLTASGGGAAAVALFLIVVASAGPGLAYLGTRLLPGMTDLQAFRFGALLIVTPAVNIYSATSEDAPSLGLISAALLFGVLALQGRSPLAHLWAACAGVLITLTIAWSFSGVAAVILLAAVLLALALRLPKYKAGLAILLMGGIPLAAYVAVRAILGYDYLQHARSLAPVAMAVSWLTNPLTVVNSRLQNVTELLLLVSPFLLGLWWIAVTQLWRTTWNPLRVRAMSLGGEFAEGAKLDIGTKLRHSDLLPFVLPIVPIILLLLTTPIYSEFARGWIGLVPFLILPAMPWLEHQRPAAGLLVTSGALLWILQAFGNHGW